MATVEEESDNLEEIDTSQFMEDQEPGEGQTAAMAYEPLYREVEIFENQRFLYVYRFMIIYSNGYDQV